MQTHGAESGVRKCNICRCEVPTISIQYAISWNSGKQQLVICKRCLKRFVGELDEEVANQAYGG